jgi:hypothetical protein
MHHDSAVPRTEDAGVIGRLLRTMAKHRATQKQSPTTTTTALITSDSTDRAETASYCGSLLGYHRTLPSVNTLENTKKYQWYTA